MNKLLVSLIALLTVGIGIFFILSNSNSDNSDITGNTVNNPKNINMKTFVVDSANLRFYIDGIENPDIKIKQEDKVRIEFTSSEGFHDWVVDEFNARTEKINAGGSSSVEFVADKKGTFEYYCSVGQHKAKGMKGNLIIE
ncbi:MAG: cupredoxin domain-containing protein [Nanoarchaeota archaeon]